MDEIVQVLRSLPELQNIICEILRLTYDINDLNELLHGDCIVTNNSRKVLISKSESFKFVNSLIDEKFKLLNKKLHNLQQYHIDIRNI